MKPLAYATMTLAVLSVAVLGQAALAQDLTTATPVPMTVTISSNGIDSSVDTPTGGLYLVTVVNESQAPRGLVLKGIDRGPSPYIRFTPVLRPGQRTAFLWYFPSDRNVQIRDIMSCHHVQRTCLAANFGRMTESLTFS